MNSLRSPLIFNFKIVLFMMSPKWGSHHFCQFFLSIVIREIIDFAIFALNKKIVNVKNYNDGKCFYFVL